MLDFLVPVTPLGLMAVRKEGAPGSSGIREIAFMAHIDSGPALAAVRIEGGRQRSTLPTAHADPSDVTLSLHRAIRIAVALPQARPWHGCTSHPAKHTHPGSLLRRARGAQRPRAACPAASCALTGASLGG